LSTILSNNDTQYSYLSYNENSCIGKKNKKISANLMIRKQQQIYDSDQYKQVQKVNNNQLLKLTDQFP
jgi:hypothetical protein